ncbi:hypothetical protein E2C01_039302 [Portunus trituberculatus]|uniref:Uncharacterized protein n=1 Tax=Portunus trituberculatus TaxID=210409 RepID=A0A5B7FL06_PORTR|nr:hypothetical protein [Portunus trituberculatus]
MDDGGLVFRAVRLPPSHFTRFPSCIIQAGSSLHHLAATHGLSASLNPPSQPLQSSASSSSSSSSCSSSSSFSSFPPSTAFLMTSPFFSS